MFNFDQSEAALVCWFLYHTMVDFSLLLTLFELLKEAITRDSIFATIRKKVCFSVRLITQKAWYLSTQFPYDETFFSEIAITFYQLMTFWSVCNLTAYWQTSGWQICCCNQKCIFMLFERVFSSKKGQGSSNLLRHSTIICSFIEQFLQIAQEKSELPISYLLVFSSSSVMLVRHFISFLFCEIESFWKSKWSSNMAISRKAA